MLVILYLLKDLFSDITSSNPMAATDADTPVVEGKFTPSSLLKYNGRDDPKIYMAVKGRVFDVTQGAAFYGPGGPYENFAGHDASRGLAKNSFELDLITPIDQPIDKLLDLSEDEKESLDNWEQHFEGKYKVVGTLHNEEKHR